MKTVLIALFCFAALATGGGAATIYSNLQMIRDGHYDVAYGDSYGGTSVFGFPLHDAQACDDFNGGAGGTLTAVSAGYVNFFGGAPVGVKIETFADLSGSPSNTASASVVSTSLQTTRWTDTLFGMFGVIVSASNLNISYGSGNSWLMIQPQDPAMAGINKGDWFYIVGSHYYAGYGGPAHGRDGAGLQNNAYGSKTWVSLPSPGSSSLAMELEGNPIPEPGFLGLAVLGLGLLTRKLKR